MTGAAPLPAVGARIPPLQRKVLRRARGACLRSAVGRSARLSRPFQEPVTGGAIRPGSLSMSPNDDPIIIVPYDPRWPEEFRAIATALRLELGKVATRIDHVGSTAVPGLAAKDVIDIQISVAQRTAEGRIHGPLETLGYVLHPANPDRTQRYFREPEGRRRTHVHVRAQGSFDEQLNLLFRDFLRAEPAAAQLYASEKRSLAERFRTDREGYVGAKEPTLWSLLVRAHSWSQKVGWSPPSSDA